MDFYMAPMEEVTGYVYRNVFHQMFGGVDKYFAPFIAPTQKKVLKTRERKDVARENNLGIPLVPQILTNRETQWIDTLDYLSSLGYTEVNINCGCPSATVVTKGKGSGMLVDINTLDAFLEFVFNNRDRGNIQMDISVKTRLGIESEDEFTPIWQVYNRYPFSEVILHPRLQKDFYKNSPRMNCFEYAAAHTDLKLCYNGDLFQAKHLRAFAKQYPETEAVMLGRGLVGNPGLIREFQTGEQILKEELREYHDRIYHGYLEALDCTRDALFKMKELWFYLSFQFADAEKHLKAVRKAESGNKYEIAVNRFFAECDLK